MSFLNTEIPSVDLRSALDGIVRRWWVVLLSVVIAMGIVFAQDSGLRTEPAGNVIVERTYEAVVETDALDIVKIDPSSIVPVPSFDNQVAILTSSETLDQLRQQTGSDAEVSVTRSEPKFTIVETIDDLNNRVSFLSTGTPAYTFRCIGETEESCNDLIDAYVSKTVELRKESVLGGLEGGFQLVTDLIATAEERLTDGSLTAEQLSAQRVELASLTTKQDALEKIRQMITGNLILVTQGSWTEGKTTASVTASSYGFGFGVGLVIGLLIALQLAALDKTIRHGWQVRRVSDTLQIVGSPFGSDSTGQKVALASALKHAHSMGASSALVVTHDHSLSPFAEEVLRLVPEIPGTIVTLASDASVQQLAGGSERAVLVLVKTGLTTRRQLAETLGQIAAGGNRILGVSLVR